jgi:hypothetical protein
MSPSERAITETKNWIINVVIGCNFCPFAAREVKLDTIHYQVNESTDTAVILQSLLDECKRLDDHPDIETTLIILTQSFKDFDEYLDLVDLADQLIETENYEGIYQVASFHPDYLFTASTNRDPSNFTNRSIYPMLHILREESIERALANFPNPDSISKKNIAFTQMQGNIGMIALRNTCFIDR